MPLLYVVVARKPGVVLASHRMTLGNFEEVTEKILTRIDDANKRMSYASDSYMYHYVCTDNELTFLCIADESFKRSSAFAFLESIQKKFETQFGMRSSTTTIPLAMNTEFAPMLNSEMKKFNLVEDQNKLMTTSEASDADIAVASNSVNKVQRVRNEVDKVKDIMVANIDQLMERGERLELLVDKTENLSQHSVAFKQTSRNLRRRMWWQNVKVMVGVGITIIVALYIIVSISCGGLAWPKCVG
jgi:vesicle-associated membrane protein 7